MEPRTDIRRRQEILPRFHLIEDPRRFKDFDWTHDGNGDHWRVTSEGREVCSLEFTEPTGVRLPLRTSWVPQALGTLAQRLDGRTWYCRPEASGTLRLCRVRRWSFDPTLFPDLARATVLTAARNENFQMVFPVARDGDVNRD